MQVHEQGQGHGQGSIVQDNAASPAMAKGKGQRAKDTGQKAHCKLQRVKKAKGKGQRAKGKGQKAKGKRQREIFLIIPDYA